ncbi:MAG: hypothetical protein IKY92_03765 [Akkermansia sp.]|nr:hypothetical protein [Akkermansia sp.]
MNILFWVLFGLLCVLLLFLTGPVLLKAPLLVADLLDAILAGFVYKLDQWKETIELLRETFGNDENDELP